MQYHNLSAFMRNARIKKKLKQTDVSILVGRLSAQTISNFERELCHPPLWCLRRLARVYGVLGATVKKKYLMDVNENIDRVLGK